MAETCKCGETFETLSAYRMHQRNECDERETVDVSGKSDDDIANELVAQLLKCEHCREQNDGAREIEREYRDGQLAIIARFRCDCGFENENTAFLG